MHFSLLAFVVYFDIYVRLSTTFMPPFFSIFISPSLLHSPTNIFKEHTMPTNPNASYLMRSSFWSFSFFLSYLPSLWCLGRLISHSLGLYLSIYLVYIQTLNLLCLTRFLAVFIAMKRKGIRSQFRQDQQQRRYEKSKIALEHI